MSTNPYAPPKADVADIHTVDSNEPVLFFPVSITKLCVMSFCTLGIYDVYWFYKNWHFIKARRQLDISPFARAVFAVFFCHSCFVHMRDDAKTAGVDVQWSPTVLTIAWVLLTLTSVLPDPFWLISLLAFVVLIPVQAQINRVNTVVAPEHDTNSSFSGANWAAIVVGGFVVIAAIVGSFLPEAALVE